MKKFLCFLLSASLCTFAANAKEIQQDNGFSYHLKTGPRQDNYKWDTSFEIHESEQAWEQFFETGDKVASELDWKNINMWEINGGFAYNGKDDSRAKNLHLDAEFSYAYAINGKVTDSDYHAHQGQTNEFSRTFAKAGGGYALSSKMAVGYNFYSPHSVRFTPIIGYAINKQKYIGKYRNLLGHDILAKWNGPFLGVEIEGEFAPKHSVKFRSEYHLAKYRADMDWPLRTDRADGIDGKQRVKNARGIDLTLSYNYQFNNNLGLNLSANYKNFIARNGKLENISIENHSFFTNLNKVRWSSKSVMAGVTYKF